MASRFVVSDNNVIEELKTSSENLNTKKVQIYCFEYLGNGQHYIKASAKTWIHTRFKNLTSSQLTNLTYE